MANSAANSLEKAILQRCEPRILSAAEVRRRGSDGDAEHESDFGFVSSHQRSDSEIQNPRESINKLQSSAADRHLELTALFISFLQICFCPQGGFDWRFPTWNSFTQKQKTWNTFLKNKISNMPKLFIFSCLYEFQYVWLTLIFFSNVWLTLMTCGTTATGGPKAQWP